MTRSLTGDRTRDFPHWMSALYHQAIAEVANTIIFMKCAEFNIKYKKTVLHLGIIKCLSRISRKHGKDVLLSYVMFLDQLLSLMFRMFGPSANNKSMPLATVSLYLCNQGILFKSTYQPQTILLNYVINIHRHIVSSSNHPLSLLLYKQVLSSCYSY